VSDHLLGMTNLNKGKTDKVDGHLTGTLLMCVGSITTVPTALTYGMRNNPTSSQLHTTASTLQHLKHKGLTGRQNTFSKKSHKKAIPHIFTTIL
jgi:hypothetical protein